MLDCENNCPYEKEHARFRKSVDSKGLEVCIKCKDKEINKLTADRNRLYNALFNVLDCPNIDEAVDIALEATKGEDDD